jgi:hypothetical protein
MAVKSIYCECSNGAKKPNVRDTFIGEKATGHNWQRDLAYIN